MQNCIIEHPIELLEVIKNLMHNPVQAQFSLWSLTGQVRAKQMKIDLLLDYVKQFNHMLDVGKAILVTECPINLSSRVRIIKSCQRREYKKKNLVPWWQLDQQIWIGHQISCFAAFLWKRSVYKDSSNGAPNVLSNHKTEAKYNENQKQNKEEIFTNK